MMELMNEMNRQMATVSPSVQLWMNWMMICFFSSILFLWKNKTARYVFLIILLTMPAGLLVLKLTGTVHLLGIPHWLLWTPLALYIYKKELTSKEFNFKSIYGVWLSLLFVTIIICLGFDIWDFSQVAIGNK